MDQPAAGRSLGQGAEEFGGRNRLVRVLPSQPANAHVSEQVLTSRDAFKSADALAIGRPVTQSRDPAATLAAIRQSLKEGMAA